MRELFPEYNKPTEEEFKKIFDEAIFVFDTSVLLNLYELPEKSKTEMLTTIKKIKKRIWLPHQVAFEYYRKRQEIIYKQEKSYDEVTKLVNDHVSNLEKTLAEKCKGHPSIDSTTINKELKKVQSKIVKQIKERQKEHPNRRAKDDIEIELNNLFKGKVGDPYEKEAYAKIYKEGEERYEKKIPPGYEDKKKGGNNKEDTRKFGDLVIWFQTIDMAKNRKKPVIFITSEKKEDWWWSIDGQLPIGARSELIREIYDKSGVVFHMYKPDQFLEHVSNYLDTKVDKEVIESFKKLKYIDAQYLSDIFKSAESLGTMPPSIISTGEIASGVINSTDLKTLNNSVDNLPNCADFNILGESISKPVNSVSTEGLNNADDRTMDGANINTVIKKKSKKIKLSNSKKSKK